jgi:hypothetical protein
VGTIISLDIGGLSISSAKNYRGNDHGFLFQPNDLQRIQSEQRHHHGEEEDDPGREASERCFSRSLAATVPRLELLGHTLKSAQTEYKKCVATCLEERESYREDGDDPSVDLMEFDEFLRFVAAVSISELDDTFAVGEQVSTPEQDCIAFRSKDASMMPTRMPSSTGLSSRASGWGQFVFGRVGDVAA